MIFFDTLYRQLERVNDLQFEAAVELCRRAERVFFIGNGGSAAMAAHFAADWLKNVEKPALCFNDGAMMSCLGNDLGFAYIYATPLLRHMRGGDLLFAISSSGQSENILRGVDAALAKGADVVTLSGFKFNNPLRERGLVNFYIASMDYGVVECAHMCILHAITNRLLDVG